MIGTRPKGFGRSKIILDTEGQGRSILLTLVQAESTEEYVKIIDCRTFQKKAT